MAENVSFLADYFCIEKHCTSAAFLLRYLLIARQTCINTKAHCNICSGSGTGRRRRSSSRRREARARREASLGHHPPASSLGGHTSTSSFTHLPATSTYTQLPGTHSLGHTPSSSPQGTLGPAMTSEAERRMARYKEERRRQLALQVAARLSSAASSSEEEESDKVSYAEYRRRRRRREAGGRGEAPGLMKQLSRRPEDVRTGGSLQQLSRGRKDEEEEHIYQTIGSLASLPGTLTTEPAR